MTETTWTYSMAGAARRRGHGRVTRLWLEHVLAPLHRALDGALRADDLRRLNGATLADIGLHRQ